MKTACLSYIEGTNYDFAGICVTFKSLREHYDGDVIVLHNNIDKKLLNFLQTQKIEAVDCSSYKVTFNTSPYNNKVIYSYLFLKKNATRFGESILLLCDISDVYFKCNPFEIYTNKLTLFLEDKPFKNCECNSTWMQICYGNDALHKIKDRTVVNAGLYLSDYKNIFNFFGLMVKDMSEILFKVNYPIVEQAIVNKLIYVDGVDCFLDSKNVNNMAQQIKTKTDNKINHQYKVFPDLKKEIYNIYAE